MIKHSFIYTGTVIHKRFKPKIHTFNYKVFSLLIDLSEIEFLNKTLKELHPADSADIIENLIPENRSKLIELEGFNLDPEIFTELNESIQTEIFIILFYTVSI